MIMALFPLVDVLIVAWAVFVEPDWQLLGPRTVLEEDRPFSWFLLLLTLQALAYRPWLAAWAGLVTAAVWLGVAYWMLSYPGAYSDPSAASGEPLRPSDLNPHMAAMYDPLFIQVEAWLREALIALVCGAILAVAAYRSQSLMARAVRAERSRANLARYFSPQMVDQLASQDQPFDQAREQRVGVLFADIVGFTSIAESLSPTQVIAFLREFHGRVAQTVFAFDGTLDKFIGDSVMVTFGTPASGREDATRTLACCHAIAETVRTWSEERRASGLAPIRVGIGAHYGPVVLGDIGDERRLEFAVLGDTVNVASRLEGLTRELGCTILASDDLVQAVQAERQAVDRLLEGFAPITPQRLRNRDHPVAVWAYPVEMLQANG
jgi:adenylate cyclase